MSKGLVIVESPAKAKTIQKYLGKDFTVDASFGHVKDLPKSSLGVDVEDGFATEYVGRVTTAKDFETIPMYRLQRRSRSSARESV